MENRSSEWSPNIRDRAVEAAQLHAYRVWKIGAGGGGRIPETGQRKWKIGARSGGRISAIAEWKC